MNQRSFLLFGVLLAGCNPLEQGVPYYSGKAPSVDGLDIDVEVGNLGGQVVKIQGSGFGDDPAGVVVQFGSTNAEILSTSDTELVVVTPKGPVEGGRVAVKVATKGGQGTLKVVEGSGEVEDTGGYEYNVGSVYGDQTGYIAINNLWNSCYGGMSDDGALGQAGCEAIAYLGTTGIDGSSEFYNFVFPRSHSNSYGWFGAPDYSEEWVVQTPAYRPFIQSVDNLRIEAPTPGESFALKNPILAGETWVANMATQASWSAQGVTLTTKNSIHDEGDASNPADILYEMDTLRFCEVEEFETDTNSYGADWAVPQSFFVPQGERDPSIDRRLSSCRDGEDNDNDDLADGQDPDCHPVVSIAAEGTDLDGLELRLPEPIFVTTRAGITAPNGQEELWALMGMDKCFTGDDQYTDLDDVAWRFEWQPSLFEPSSDERILGQETHVRISFTTLGIGWFGTEAQPARTTIVVDDFNNYDETTDRSSVEMPTEVWYQLPSVNGQWGCSETQLGATFCEWGDPLTSDYGYLIVTVDRVTEYLVDGKPRQFGGEVILAYTTGDFGFLSNEHPLDRADSCDNCEDDDGDGWVDALDGDCMELEGDPDDMVYAEDGSREPLGNCSDGVDNDGDGDVDVDDEDCVDGISTESNCGNGLDDDEDGWIDEDDAECADPDTGLEQGNDVTGCADGVDNDGDGWVDSGDPGCLDGFGAEDDGYEPSLPCNDGLDNDGHTDVDAEDPACFENGAWAASEEPEEYRAECVDLVTNDGDAYVDEFDPDCQYWPNNKENAVFQNPALFPLVRACYDNEDNDEDGLTDSEDPGCWNTNEDFGWVAVPDGFLNDEADDGDCTDGVDNDGDGATDLDDPGCAPYVGKSEDAADPV
jgi:hypothetical protein